MRAAGPGGHQVGWWPARLSLFAIASLLFGSGCHPSSVRPKPAAPIHLTIALAQPASLRNAAPGDMGLNSVLYLLSNERLIAISNDGRPEPALAERWVQSADGLSWRVYLRPNLQFQDGTPLDAPHVAKALTAAVAGGLPGVVLREVTSVTAEDATTLVFHLRRRTSLLIDALIVLPINTGVGAKPSGAGPFQLLSRQPGEIHLRSFPQYFKGRPNIDEIDVRVYPNPRNAWSAMMRDEVDFLYDVAPEAIDFIDQSTRAEVKTFLRPYVFVMGMSMRHPVLRRREVRVALNQAVNRTQILDVVFRGRGYPASNHVWPKHWAYNHLLPRFRFLPGEASAMLDAANLPVQSSAGTRTRPRFSFECLVPELDMRYERIALMLQQQLIDVGVDMQLRAVPPMDMARRMAKGDYDAVLLDLISTRGLTSVYDVWHSPGDRPAYIFSSGYTAADEALDRLQGARTDAETRNAVNELQRVTYEDPPAIFLCWGERARAVSTRFRVPHVTDRDVVATLPQWQLAPQTVGERSP